MTDVPTIHPDSIFTIEQVVMKFGLSAIERGYLERTLEANASEPPRYRSGRNVTRYTWAAVHQALIELGVLQ